MTTLTPFDSRDPVNETKGGTAQSSFASGNILYASGANTLSKLNVGTDGQILTVSGGVPAWSTPSPIPSSNTSLSIYEEFFAVDNILSQGNFVFDPGAYGWILGTTTGVTAVSGTQNNPGILSIGVTAATNYIKLGSDPFAGGSGSITLDWVIKVPTVSTGTQRFITRIGLMDGTTGSPNNGFWFEQVDDVNSGNWTINTNHGGGSPSSANTGSSLNTNFHRYRITVDASLTAAHFYIDGVEVTGSPITTTLTTNFITPRISISKTVGATARSLEADLMWFRLNLTNPRI